MARDVDGKPLVTLPDTFGRQVASDQMDLSCAF